MEQNNTVNSGASNASDFQPPTGNPQSGTGQIFPKQEQVQSGGQSELLNNKNLIIQVPVNPAPPQPKPTAAKQTPDIILMVILWIVVGVILLWILRKYFKKTSQIQKPSTQTTFAETTAPSSTNQPKATTRTQSMNKSTQKKKQNKKKSKKRKRK